jgi:hypothetical protein
VTRIDELGTTLAATSNRRTLRRNTNSLEEIPTHMVFIRSVHLLLVAASVVPSSPIFVTLLPRVTRRNIPEDTILHSHRRKNLKSYKSYIALTGCAL